MRKIEPLAGKFIVGILIILFSVTGCSDMPYTGSILTVREVDRYLVSTDGEAVCFQDDSDSTCIKLTPETENSRGATNASAIHIYPEKHLYIFYHEGKPILRAERAGGQGTQGTQTSTGGPRNPLGGDPSTPNGGGGNNGNNNGNNGNPDDPNGNNNGNNGNNNGNNGNPDDPNGDSNNNNDNNNGSGDNPDDPNGDSNDNKDDPSNNSDDGHGWIIWVYYPDGAAPESPPTLTESGVTVTINGKQLTNNDITGFAQFIGPDNEKGIQFFYPTKSAELLDLKVRMEGIVDAEDTAKFNINYLWEAQ